MSDENCTRTSCPCPCLPRVSLDQAVIDLVESIALQENALSHILCAESRKMDAAMELVMPHSLKPVATNISGVPGLYRPI